ncbi:UDP-glycosyltransferase 72C1-like [Miscanthus floridulus]|uniref:UDP-glycosyltransferase 72C1-like n=1 Tax=Miscanthus floridulus TaxID=154761 RepID=UPI00345B26DC
MASITKEEQLGQILALLGENSKGINELKSSMMEMTAMKTDLLWKPEVENRVHKLEHAVLNLGECIEKVLGSRISLAQPLEPTHGEQSGEVTFAHHGNSGGPLCLSERQESAGRPFVWAVRSPFGREIKGDFRADQFLPDGFEERARTSNRGLLARGWALQVRILAHASTGAFLSHCEWNSVLENATHGVSIIGWPLSGEQFYNANMLKVEWGVCMEMARGERAGHYRKQGLRFPTWWRR